MVWARCIHTGCNKRFRGSTALSAKSALYRHVRECQTTHGKVRAARRRAAHGTYKLVRKKLQQEAQAAANAILLAFVLCPLRRELSHHMFTQTTVNLVAGGFAPQRIRRLQGYDLQNLVSLYCGQPLPKAVKPHQCCMVAMHMLFIFRGTCMFMRNPQLRFIMWFEDDVSFVNGKTIKDLQAVPGSDTRTTAVWCGYRSKSACQIYGSHAVSFIAMH